MLEADAFLLLTDPTVPKSGTRGTATEVGQGDRGVLREARIGNADRLVHAQRIDEIDLSRPVDPGVDRAIDAEASATEVDTIAIGQVDVILDGRLRSKPGCVELVSSADVNRN